MKFEKQTTNHIIISALIAAVIFGGLGYYAGKKTMSVPAGRQGGGGQFRGGTGGRGFQGGGAALGNVISIDNSMMTVGTRDGASKVVILTGSTKVLKSIQGTIKDVSTGGSVIVTGTPNNDGSITADTIQIRPAGVGTSTQR